MNQYYISQTTYVPFGNTVCTAFSQILIIKFLFKIIFFIFLDCFNMLILKIFLKNKKILF